jgi:hypothetical protein
MKSTLCIITPYWHQACFTLSHERTRNGLFNVAGLRCGLRPKRSDDLEQSLSVICSVYRLDPGLGKEQECNEHLGNYWTSFRWVVGSSDRPELCLCRESRPASALGALVSLAANEVQESVKFSSREKLAVCKVVEGAVKLSPGRGQSVASLEVVGQFRIEQDQTWSQDSPVGLGKEHRHSATEWRQLVAMAVRHFQDEPLAFEPAQIVSGLSSCVGRVE